MTQRWARWQPGSCVRSACQIDCGSWTSRWRAAIYGVAAPNIRLADVGVPLSQHLPADDALASYASTG